MTWLGLDTGMGGASSAKQHDSADSSTESLHPLSDEHRDFIQKSLDAWCANSGYKDCNDCTVNMLTLSRTLSIPKDELSAYFDQYLKTIFRIGLGDFIVALFLLLFAIVMSYAMVQDYRIYLDENYKARYSFCDFIKRERYYIYLFLVLTFVIILGMTVYIMAMRGYM